MAPPPEEGVATLQRTNLSAKRAPTLQQLRPKTHGVNTHLNREEGAYLYTLCLPKSATRACYIPCA